MTSLRTFIVVLNVYSRSLFICRFSLIDSAYTSILYLKLNRILFNILTWIETQSTTIHYVNSIYTTSQIFRLVLILFWSVPVKNITIGIFFR